MDTVFISYQRSSSGALAHLIHERITAWGLDVFLDVENITQGRFDTILEREIIERTFFIVLLTPQTLNSEWVVREIETALRHNKKIVSVLVDGFTFSSPIPDAISQLRLYHGITYHHEYAEGFFDKLKKALEGDNSPRLFSASPFRAAAQFSRPARSERRLEAAMPQKTRLATKTEVWVKVPLGDSEGLRAELPDYTEMGDEIQKGDVHSTTLFPLEFPRDPRTGELMNTTACLKVTADDFRVKAHASERCKEGQAALDLAPDYDSRTVIFQLTPKSEPQAAGRSRVVISLFHNEKLVAQTSVSTELVESREELVKIPWNLQAAALALASSPRFSPFFGRPPGAPPAPPQAAPPVRPPSPFEERRYRDNLPDLGRTESASPADRAKPSAAKPSASAQRKPAAPGDFRPKSAPMFNWCAGLNALFVFLTILIIFIVWLIDKLT